jgi:hypothetical protein
MDPAMTKVLNDMIRESGLLDRARRAFDRFDTDGSGQLDLQEFKDAYKQMYPNVTDIQLDAIFQEADLDGGGTLDFEEFITIARIPEVEVLGKLGVQNRNERGLLEVEQSMESFFGEELRKNAPEGVGAFLMSQSQTLSMELYESRIASMQRFVAMTVMFHQVSLLCVLAYLNVHTDNSYFTFILDGNESPVIFRQYIFWIVRIQDGQDT